MKMNDTGRIAGQVAIVTGAAQGLGEALSVRLNYEGCSIGLADINYDAVEKVAGRLNDVMPMRVDVTDERQVDDMVSKMMEKYGRIDLLISNAAILISGSVVDFSVSEWRKMIDVNLTGYFLCAKAVARAMIPRHKGNIIHINSKTGKKGSYRNSAYAASKFGGIGFTQSLALELAEYNIRVNAICPGNLLDSPLWINSLYEQYAKNQNVTAEEIKRRYLAQVPIGRNCTYDDVSNVMVFLASDEASYMTGQAINVTGGQEMR